ncbi:MAG: zinc ribbon domain-containing protein [Proteobacteria bacterium]|nr:zinc ribbon domain-containing protein [Pseudomonadota bacterium]
MPFYEYECQACGVHHEALQKMSDKPLVKCPACGKPKLKRLVSAPVFRLKGGGWYETDFKSDAEKKRNLHGDEAKADKAEKGEKGDQPAKADKAEAGAKPSESMAPPAAKPEAKVAPKAGLKAAGKPSAKAPSRARRPARKPSRRR